MESKTFSVSGNIVDVVGKRIFQGTIRIKEGKISDITEEKTSSTDYILPGFIDAHVHIESSMLIPSEFARLAVVHGTVATVSDPHEIANVLGIDGVKFMINNGKKVPFKFFFGAPSCVPATPFETSGASIGIKEVNELLAMEDIHYLSEMMNFPGVLFKDAAVAEKLNLAKKYNKPVDGHAPGLKGEDALTYAQAGISTDHECFTIEEATDKIKAGMKILIREGSAAKNFDALVGLIENYPESIMFCSDDKHPNDLVDGHINLLVKRAIALGYDPITVLRIVSYNVVKHYHLNVGLIQPGDDADFIIADDLKNLEIKATYIKGQKVAGNGKTAINSIAEIPINAFNATPITANDIVVKAKGKMIKVQKAIDGQLITELLTVKAKVRDGNVESDIENDILKMVVLNRYQPSAPAVGFIHNFGLKHGAIASTVAHDSHNIIAVGISDEEIVKVVNALINSNGGVCATYNNEIQLLKLSLAGLMSDNDGYNVALQYNLLDKTAKKLGCQLVAPFMTLSFMALLVIPSIKLSDRGLFDGNRFELTNLFTD